MEGIQIRRFFAKIFLLVGKDLVMEARSKELFFSIALFSLLMIVVINFSFDTARIRPEQLGAGIVWITFLFAGMVGLGRTFSSEKQEGTLEGLLLLPLERTQLYLGKTLVNLIFMLAVEIAAVPLFIILLDIPILENLGPFTLVLLLGTIGFVFTATLFSAVSFNTRLKEVMLPLLIIPLIIPVLISAVKATHLIFIGGADSSLTQLLGTLLLFDLSFSALSLLLFEFVVTE